MIEQLFVRDAFVIKHIAIYSEILATDTFWDLTKMYFVILNRVLEITFYPQITDTFWDLNNIYFLILDRVLEMTFYPQMSICTSKTY